jgi:hypothetical protein
VIRWPVVMNPRFGRVPDRCSSKGWSFLASPRKILLSVLGIVSLAPITMCDRRGAPPRPPSASTPAAEPRPAAPAANFPSLADQFITLRGLPQKAFSETFKGTVLSGTGTVFQVDACDVLDDSARWGAKCAKLVLDNGASRVVLYFDEKYRAMLASYRREQTVTFTDCTAISVKNWGFGPVATCDMR